MRPSIPLLLLLLTVLGGPACDDGGGGSGARPGSRATEANATDAGPQGASKGPSTGATTKLGQARDDDARSEEVTDTSASALSPELGLELEAWSLSVKGDQLDAVAVGDTGPLYVATQIRPERPLIDPALVRITAHRPEDEAGVVAWQAAILGPSPLALAAAGDRTLAVWSERAHPGRELAFVVLGAQAEHPTHRRLMPGEDTGFEPVDRPLVAATPGDRADGGWLVCSRAVRGAPRCAHLDHQARARSWHTLRGMKSYPLWRLVPVGEGFFAFGASCPIERCRAPRIVMQPLSADGVARGSLRFLTRLQAHRSLGVVPVAGGALLFGRRLGAKHGMAMRVKRRGVEELRGRFTRTVAAAPTSEGLLLAELDTLHMVDGHPRRSIRPRRWRRAGATRDRRGRATDGRLATATWPPEISARLPQSLDQEVIGEQGLIVAWDLPRGGQIHGVALRPGSVTAAKVDAPSESTRP